MIPNGFPTGSQQLLRWLTRMRLALNAHAASLPQAAPVWQESQRDPTSRDVLLGPCSPAEHAV